MHGRRGAGGANVVGLDIDEVALAGAEATVTSVGGDFLGRVADVRVKDEVDAAIQAAVEAYASVDGLVHVVGGQQPHHWHAVDDFAMSHFDEVLDLNLRSALLTSQAAAMQMIASGRGGSIVHIASVAAFFAAPFIAAYAVAKAGLVSLTRTMAAEWGGHDIRVNAVAAGTIRTPRSRGDDRANAAARRGAAAQATGHARGAGRCRGVPPERPRWVRHRSDGRRGRWIDDPPVVPRARRHPGLRGGRRAPQEVGAAMIRRVARMLPAASGAPGTRISYGKWTRRGWMGTGYLVARQFDDEDPMKTHYRGRLREPKTW